MSGAPTINVLVCALGGEGGGVLAQWLYETAVASGHPAQATSIPGVAQRTGATTYYIEVGVEPAAANGGRRPLFSLNPAPGAIDLLVSSELLETVRQIGLGLPSAARSTVISSSARTLTVIEKMAPGDGRRDDVPLVAAVQRHARESTLLDLTALAQASGAAMSALLFGAIAASGRLPFARPAFEDAIRRGGKGVESSLRGFAAAFDAVSAARVQREALVAPIERALMPAAPALPADVAAAFPAAVLDVLALGHARLLEYQDAAYAQLYVERLRAVLAAERVGDPLGQGGHATTRECARWLALWMAFDDIVRVAALKLNAARLQRVRREVAAREDEVVKVYDHFKPGVPEIAALLPAGLARRLMAWDERRQARGLVAWSLPLKVGTHTVIGTLALRLAAGLKGQRRRGSRFAAEQALIEQWLAAVCAGAQEHAALGHELALCGRLIKGYGSTNERGKHNLLHITQHLALPASGLAAPARAEAIRAAREAALADEGGRALDATLAAHGAPPRPVAAQPIRWHKRRPAPPAGTPPAGLPGGAA
jgi:indolepyruvate ferredoxin oxidoreductase beta subunit